MGFDFTLIAPLLPSHCGFSSVLGRGVSSLVKSRVSLSMIVQQPVVILVLSQEGVRARPSTPPSWLISKVARWILNHWTTREVPDFMILMSLFTYSRLSFCCSLYLSLLSKIVLEGSLEFREATTRFWCGGGPHLPLVGQGRSG